MNGTIWIMICVFVFSLPATAWSFDHTHAQWDRMLKAHVRWINGGVASQVDYAGFKKAHPMLKAYLDELSGVSQNEFGSWDKPQQLAFLINAYNAFTVELILTRYPDLGSIKDLGSFFSSPWKKTFFSILGKERSLDWIEHDMIRKPGLYDDPRIHAAVNCASVGCPALRDEAFTALKIDEQLEDGLRRFLMDRSRNRYHQGTGELEVSKIFDWYGDDFEKGHRGYDSLSGFFARYADLLADHPDDRKRIGQENVRIVYLDYDWRLNDVSR